MAYDTSKVTKIKDIIKSEVETNFVSTLGQEPDIVNIVSALVLRESSFNPSATSRAPNPAGRGTAGGSYINSSAVQSVISQGDSVKNANIIQGLFAVGLMQVLGMYFVRGGSPTGVGELERLRPDLAADMMVDPGESIFDGVLGPDNQVTAIRAGLIILEGKYRATKFSGSGYSIKGDPLNRKFPSQIAGAVAGYLGLGRADLNGTTPEAYSAQIVGGSFYAAANSGTLKVKGSTTTVASSNGPTTNSTGQKPLGIAGCG